MKRILTNLNASVILSSLLMFLTVSISCAPSHDVVQNGDGNPNNPQSPDDGRKQEDGGDGTDAVTPPLNWDFAFVKEKVLQPYCIDCHKSFANYSAVQKRKDEIALNVEMGWMPKPPLKMTTFEKKIILDWIDAGAPEFSNTPPPTEP